MFCHQCGKKLEDYMVFCPYCGEKTATNIFAEKEDELTEETKEDSFKDNDFDDEYMREDKSSCSKEIQDKVFTILPGHTVSFNLRFQQYNNICCYFERQASLREMEANKLCEEANSCDEIYLEVFPACLDMVNELTESAAGILRRFGIDYIDSESIAERLNERCNILDAFGKIKIGAIQIRAMNKAAEENSKNPQDYWVGGGFGIGGAIKGAVKAEIMNIGTRALIGLAKNITGNTDQDKIERAKQRMYESGELENGCTNGVYRLCSEIFFVVYDILVEHRLVSPMEFDEERAVGKYRNIVKMYEGWKCDGNQAIRELCRCIEIFPYHLWFMAYIFKIDNRSRHGLEALAKYLGIDIGLSSWLKTIELNPKIIPGF